jgi:quinol-cytochrome oxidoreductase complex cytochrome b subunit
MPSTTLYRLAGQAGVATGILLLFNDARRVGLVPENAFTHEIAPIPAFLAPFALIGLYLWQRERIGPLGLWGFALNLAGLVGVATVEFTLHFVFPLLDKQTVDRLVDGRTGMGFLIASIVFLTGTVLFGLAMWRADRFPRWAVILYVVGFVPTALRSILPAPVVSLGFVLGSVAISWLSVTLVLAVARSAPTAVSPARIPNTTG